MIHEYPTYFKSDEEPADPHVKQLHEDGSYSYLLLPENESATFSDTQTVQDTEKIRSLPEVSTRRDVLTGLAAASILAMATGFAAKNNLLKSNESKNEREETEPWYYDISYGDTASGIVWAVYSDKDAAEIEEILQNHVTVVRENGDEDNDINMLYVGDRLKITYPQPTVTPEP